MPEAVARRYHNLFLNAPTKTLTLSAAAKKESNVERIGICCNCRTGCTTNRCTCHKNNEQCTQYCHPFEYNCGNMAERIIDRTEKPIVDCHRPSEITSAASQRKRTSTVTSPNQRRYKIAKTTQPNTSNTGSVSGEPLRRLGHPPASSSKTQYNIQHVGEAEELNNNDETESDNVEKQHQTTLF